MGRAAGDAEPCGLLHFDLVSWCVGLLRHWWHNRRSASTSSMPNQPWGISEPREGTLRVTQCRPATLALTLARGAHFQTLTDLAAPWRRHLFCAGCLAERLKSDGTCPICYAVVTPENVVRECRFVCF